MNEQATTEITRADLIRVIRDVFVLAKEANQILRTGETAEKWKRHEKKINAILKRFGFDDLNGEEV